MYSLKLGALVYWEKLLRAIGGRKRKMEWGTKRKRQRESVWERKRWNGRVKQEREQERGREEEREYRPSVVFKCEAENHLCGSGEWRAIPVLDERVCRAWIIALSLFRSLFVLQCPWFQLQASKWEDRKTESFYKTTIPGRGDIWTPHNGWIEDKVLSSPTAVPEWYRYSSCFSCFLFFFAFYQVSACSWCNRNVQKTNMLLPWCKQNGCFFCENGVHWKISMNTFIWSRIQWLL